MDLNEALRRAKADAADKPRTEAIKEAVEEVPAAPEASHEPGKPEGGAEKALIESYGDVRISKAAGEALYYYEIPAPHYRGEEKALINTLLEIASGVIADEIGLTKKEKRKKYLEKILQIIEATPELRIPIHAKQFYAEAVVKEMAGFGVIDPLLDDDQLEEIMIIGPQKPVYVFHRKYEMMKTNIFFYEDKDIRNIIDKMGRTIGRRIDNQNPLLDARLPDGSRVNATIAPASIDGSTLTLRKFRKDPLTIIDLINSNTVDLDVAALLWLVGDGMGARPGNILVAGGTACGKCMTADTPVSMADGSLPSIGGLVEDVFSQAGLKVDGDGWEYAAGNGMNVLTFDPESMQLQAAPIERYWRHKSPPQLVRIRTRSGKQMRVTPEHPFFILREGSLVQIRADKLGKGMQVAAPRVLPVQGRSPPSWHSFLTTSGIFVRSQAAKAALCSIRSRPGMRNYRDVSGYLGVNFRRMRQWSYGGAMPAAEFYRLLARAGVSPDSAPAFISSKTSSRTMALPKQITPSMLRFVGLILADGHLEHKYVEFHNSDEERLQEFALLAENEFGARAVIEYPKARVARARVYSSVLARLMHDVFEVPFGNKAARISIPDWMLRLSEKHLSSLVSGLFDCDGSVVLRTARHHEIRLEYSTKSRELANRLAAVLLRFELRSNVLTKNGQWYVSIYSHAQCRRFAEAIPLLAREKRETLEKILSLNMHPATSSDVFAGIGTTLAGLRASRGWSQAQAADAWSVSPRLVRAYEHGSRRPTRHVLGRIAGSSDGGQQQVFLQRLYGADVFFDEIVDVELLSGHGEKYVYDLTVQGTHTFIAGTAGGLVAHNTTTLNVLASFIPGDERIVSIEDTAELSMPLEHWIRLEVRPASVEGTGEISMNTLVKNSLRMRPDRVIVGEIRGEEGFTMFTAMNTGHNGCLGTVHSNSAKETLVRLGSPPISVSPVMLNALNFIVMQHRIHDRRKG
ncbi:MAG: ATPase, T2SS/T4P/T4SS family, partial [Candidatus Micrarchaeota archaeon]